MVGEYDGIRGNCGNRVGWSCRINVKLRNLSESRDTRCSTLTSMGLSGATEYWYDDPGDTQGEVEGDITGWGADVTGSASSKVPSVVEVKVEA
jgi:hypothetical protein